MKCPRCGSEDIAEIKGRTRCLACGYAVRSQATAATKTKARRTKGKTVDAMTSMAPVSRAATAPAVQAVTGSRGRSLDLVSTPRAAHIPAKSNKLWPSQAHPARFTLRVAAGLALAIGALVAVALWFNLDSDVAAYLVAAGATSVVIWAILAQSALLYGISRFDDGRPAPRQYWWGVARDGFMDVVNADMMALIVMAVAVLVSISAWRLSSHATGLSSAERYALLGVVNIGLSWVLLGAYTARRMALAAVVIGGVTAGEATKIGWRLYLRAGGHLIVTTMKALLGRVIAVAVIGLGLFLVVRVAPALMNGNQTQITVASAIAAALAVFLLVTVLLEWETRLWLRHYRLWVTTFTPIERVRLLTGRPPAKS